MSQPLLSILVPMYNESENIPFFFEVMEEVLTNMGLTYEIICVNDGSTDNTFELLCQHAEQDGRIKVISFSRNFGKEAAMTAALDYASGDAVVPIDADMQDPPELIKDMMEKWREGYDVVFAKRASRETDSFAKRQTAYWFYALMNFMSEEVKIPENVGDYRLMDRRVVEAIKQLPEKERFMKGLFSWPGFRSMTLEYNRPSRTRGQTKFSYWRLWNFALNGITSFSTLPIRIAIYLGILISSLSFFYGCWVIVKTLVFGIDEPGYASIVVLILFFGGINLFFIGIMGEYIGRIYKEVKNRPLYIVDKKIGFQRD